MQSTTKICGRQINQSATNETYIHGNEECVDLCICKVAVVTQDPRQICPITFGVLLIEKIRKIVS